MDKARLANPVLVTLHLGTKSMMTLDNAGPNLHGSEIFAEGTGLEQAPGDQGVHGMPIPAVLLKFHQGPLGKFQTHTTQPSLQLGIQGQSGPCLRIPERRSLVGNMHRRLQMTR